MRTRITLPALVALGLVSLAAQAQGTCPCPPPPPPEPAWKASVGGGLSVTSGNTDANTYNLTLAVTHDPHRRNVFKVEGLYLRSGQHGEVAADKTQASARDEYKLGRAYLFGQLAYLRDPLKEVESLFAPAVGAGYRLIDRKDLLLAADASVGGAFEKLTGRDGTSALALSAGQRLERLTGDVKPFEKASGLWKTSDFGDAYYHFEAGLAATLARRLELRVTFMDDYKNKPASALLKKNDTAFVLTFVLKT